MSDEAKFEDEAIEFEILPNGDISFFRYFDKEKNEAMEEILLACGADPKEIGTFFSDMEHVRNVSGSENFCG